jgi:hypothetical protein
MTPKGRDLLKGITLSPDTRPQGTKLHDLRMVDEHVDIEAELPNVPACLLAVEEETKRGGIRPVENAWISSLKHHLLHRQLIENLLNYIGSPRGDVLRDTLTLDHYAFDASVRELTCHSDEFGRIPRANVFQLARFRITASTELNT